jgi:hypothetical protein
VGWTYWGLKCEPQQEGIFLFKLAVGFTQLLIQWICEAVSLQVGDCGVIPSYDPEDLHFLSKDLSCYHTLLVTLHHPDIPSCHMHFLCLILLLIFHFIAWKLTVPRQWMLMTVYGKLLGDVIKIISLSLGASMLGALLHYIRWNNLWFEIVQTWGYVNYRDGFEIITPKRREIILSVLCRCDFSWYVKFCCSK